MGEDAIMMGVETIEAVCDDGNDMFDTGVDELLPVGVDVVVSIVVPVVADAVAFEVVDAGAAAA
jgi:hypothetical protein